jgi:hypothetical protein
MCNFRTGEFSTSKNIKDDKFDRSCGIAVAYAKLRGQKIPDYI